MRVDRLVGPEVAVQINGVDLIAVVILVVGGHYLKIVSSNCVGHGDGW